MKIILEERRKVLTEYGRYRLKYELFACIDTQERREDYGIRICQVRDRSGELFDLCEIRGITEDKVVAEELFYIIVEGLVMPVSLQEVVEDWRCALFV